MQKITKFTNIEYPLKAITENEKVLVSYMIKNNLSISWNGQDLRAKNLVDSKRGVLSFLTTPLVAEEIRNLMDLKILYPHVMEYKSGYKQNLISVNPFFTKFILLPDVPKVTFKIEDIDVTIVRLFNFEIPYHLRTKIEKANFFESIDLRTFAKSLYLYLLGNGYLHPYLFKIKNDYYIFRKGSLYEIKKEFIENILGIQKNKETQPNSSESDKKEDNVNVEEPKVEEEKEPVKEADEEKEVVVKEKEVLPSIETGLNTETIENNFSEISFYTDDKGVGYYKLGNKSYANNFLLNVDSLFITKVAKMLLEYEVLEGEDEYNNIIEFLKIHNKNISRNNYLSRKITFASKREVLSSDEQERVIAYAVEKTNLASVIKESNKMIDEVMDVYKKLEKEGRVKSIRKLDTTYTKPLSKLNLGENPTMATTIVKLMDYIGKNALVDYTDEEIIDKCKSIYENTTIEIEKIEPYPLADKIPLQFIKYLLPNYKGDISDFKFFIGTQKTPLNDNRLLEKELKMFLPKKALYAVEMNNKSGSWKTNTHFALSMNVFQKILGDEFLEHGFTYVTVNNLNSIDKDTRVLEELIELGDFNEKDITEIKRIQRQMRNNSIPKVIKYIDRSIKFAGSSREEYKESITKIHDALSAYFEQQLRKEMSEKLKGESSSYARSYETKKNIHKYIQEAMENNQFAKEGNNFKFVEIDNDVDLDLFKIIESEYQEIVSNGTLPVLPAPITLRFRKLGKLKAGNGSRVGGVYYPELKTLCVDISNESSFIHEYGHALDFEYAYNKENLSKEKEFAPIVDAYRNELKKHYSGADFTYFSMEEEVFARAFEIYLNNKLNTNGRLRKSEEKLKESPEYSSFEGLENQIITYFKNIFSL